jgi:signal transduction histidine kinase
MLFGEYLLERGKLSSSEVDLVCNIQKKSTVPIGQLAVDNKFMSLADVLSVRSNQQSTGAMFGEVAVRLDILKPRQVEALLELQKDLRPYFGELLVKNNLMSEEEFIAHLRQFKTNQAADLPETSATIVAVVDIRKESLFKLQNEFLRRGYNVITELFSPESFLNLPSLKPGFVVMDVSNRRMEKLDALMKIREARGTDEFRVLAIADKLNAGDREAAALAGITEIVPTKADPVNIVSYIHSLLAGLSDSRTGKVLLVDDSFTALKLMSHCLEKERYETYLASSGEEALSFLEKSVPDLILTDIFMPGMNGIELCKIIKNNPKTRNIPVVAVTTAKSILRLKEALEAGASDYMIKPFQHDELLARVRSHIKTKRLIDELQNSKRELLYSNEKLGEANNRKIEFLATVAHDLRTPLTSIQTYSELLGMKNVAINDQKEFVEIIRLEVMRMSGLIKNYLDISRMESAAGIYAKADVDLSAMAAYFAKIYDTMAKKKSILFTSSIKIPDLTVTGNKERLEQVLANLLDNAVKYTQPGGKITFSLSQITAENRKLAEITVSDNGIGIAPDAKQFLFKKFHYLHDGTESVNGLGLGLAICKEIVDGHGGKIELESEPDKGSTFRVTLPLGKGV